MSKIVALVLAIAALTAVCLFVAWGLISLANVVSRAKERYKRGGKQ